ncbi:MULTISPECIES: carboxymuconolactone decarboxylase family protein [Marinobacter]|uniref:Peroxidase n=1 Tax=Marinobacter suaedae TaxID=3057675 RepID=A0ABT8VXL0_9GAMM|nr:MULTISPECIES: hypothetical protein [unclassified Marinobacter]MBZ2168836.1 hypothetical protein [Marinobacter sp. F4216]MDO3720711.1 hypothetical protein [Marinobacter sp. chi1]
MTFINIIDPAEANADVLAMYDTELKGNGFLPSYAKVFCHRPKTMDLWADLHRGIREQLDRRLYELATVAAAVELKSTACSLAHGAKLARFYSADDVLAIASGEEASAPGFSEQDVAVMALARKVARDAGSVEADDIQRLKASGLTDGEVFDIVATAAGRAFFTKLVEGLGALPDAEMAAVGLPLCEGMVVGKPIDGTYGSYQN